MKIAIVNDQPIACEALRRVVEKEASHEIVWLAHNGVEALELCREHLPDLVLMDLIMPRMDGVETTRQLMKHNPCAILVVTSDLEAHRNQVFEAMSHGALDAVATPQLGGKDSHSSSHALLEKINTIEKLVHNPPPPNSLENKKPPPSTPSARTIDLLILGGSTGGPHILAQILSQLPRDFPASLAIVQHVDALFAPSLATWLDEQTELSVRMASPPHSNLQPGIAWLAATQDHMILCPDQTLAYSPHPETCPYRPSIDAFFHSVAQGPIRKGCAVLLTGMGCDGVDGMIALKQKNFHTIAQEETSCVIPSMPRAAIQAGAVDEILPPEKIASRILHFFKPTSLP